MQEFSTLSPEQAFQLCAHVVEQITGGLVVGTKGLQALEGLRQTIRQLAQGTKPQAKALATTLSQAESQPTDEGARATLAMVLVETLRADPTSARQVLELLAQIDPPMTEFAGAAKAKGEDSDLVIAGHLTQFTRVLPGATFEAEGKNVNTIIGVKIGE